MQINAMVEGNRLTLTCGTEEDYGTIVEGLQAAIEIIYKLKDSRETAPRGCLYKIADENPKKLRVLIEDTSGEVDPITKRFKGIDQVLATLPSCTLTKKDVLPCMQTLEVRPATGAGSQVPPRL
ncbi:MAG: hypothetical protein K0R66_624 [Gammaproteobacteria bacterium]|jgi:hypothetical protein|nr:hypothetical protein [Gammaproteobacteria bacterium]